MYNYIDLEILAVENSCVLIFLPSITTVHILLPCDYLRSTVKQFGGENFQIFNFTIHTHTHTHTHSLHAKLMLQNSDEYSASSTPNLSRLEATLLSQDDTLSSRTDGGRGSGRGTFSIDYDAESIRSVNSMDYSVDPEVKQREAVKEQLLLQDVGEHGYIFNWLSYMYVEVIVYSR